MEIMEKIMENYTAPEGYSWLYTNTEDHETGIYTGTLLLITCPGGRKIQCYGSSILSCHDLAKEIIQQLEHQKKPNIQKARELLKKSDFFVTLQPDDVREMIKLILDELERKQDKS